MIKRDYIKNIYNKYIDNYFYLKRYSEQYILSVLYQKFDTSDYSLKELDKLIHKFLDDFNNTIVKSNDSVDDFKFSTDFKSGNEMYFYFNGNGKNGFLFDYILFIPSNLRDNITLLVEPNNSSFVSLNYEDGKKTAIKNILGRKNNPSLSMYLSKELGLPLLCPILPRYLNDEEEVNLASLEKNVLDNVSLNNIKLPTQIINMINNSLNLFEMNRLSVNKKVICVGNGNTGFFANRFSLLHPEIVYSQVVGNISGQVCLPVDKYEDINLPYPVGTYGIDKYGTRNNFDSIRNIPMFIFLGKDDVEINDTVYYSSFCSEENLVLWKKLTGDYKNSLLRFNETVSIMKKLKMSMVTKIYERSDESYALSDAKIFLENILDNIHSVYLVNEKEKIQNMYNAIKEVRRKDITTKR